MPTNAPVHSGNDRAFAASAMTAKALPMPNSAAPMGSPIAISEPNAMNRITIAARRPIASEPNSGCSVMKMMSPPVSVRRPLPAAASTSVTSSFATSRSTSFARLSKMTDARAMVPSCEIIPGCWPNGDSTATTPGSACASARSFSMRAWMSGWRMPPGASNTTSAESPERAGKRSASRSKPACDSEPGSLKLLSYAPPIVFAAKMRPMSTTTHPPITNHFRRCEKRAQRSRNGLLEVFGVLRLAICASMALL